MGLMALTILELQMQAQRQIQFFKGMPVGCT